MTVRDVETGDVELAMAEADELGRGPFLREVWIRILHSLPREAWGSLLRPQGPHRCRTCISRYEQQALTLNDFDATQAIDQLRSLGFEVLPFRGLWWVNQSATFRQERAGGYVWAPKLNKAGFPMAHHVAVSKLLVGQQSSTAPTAPSGQSGM